MTFQFCSQRCLSCETDSVSICAAELDIRNLNCDQDSVRICGQGVEGANHFIQTDTFGSSSVIPSASAYSQIGRLFAFRDIVFYTDISPTFQLLFRNPADNNRTMYLDKFISGITISPQEQKPLHYECQLLTHIHRDLTLNDPGIAVPGIPWNVGFFDTSSSIEVRIFVSAGLDLLRELFITRQLNEMITVDFEGRIILPPGHDLIFTFEANRIGTPNISLEQAFTISYYEL